MSLLTDNREGADEHLIFIFSNLLNNMHDQFVVNFKDTRIMMLLVCFEKKQPSENYMVWMAFDGDYLPIPLSSRFICTKTG